MAYTIKYSVGVTDDLRAVPAYRRRELLDRIDTELIYTPQQVTRNKKMLPGLIPPWEHMPPVWELRIGEIRVFYDIDDEAQIVSVRAIRRKPAHRSTEEIL
ncbi:MAG: type II toxin-antitoxin system RelE/ParE family toxin [Caldilineaceae bacterium]|nr:type II toxin-antitoxin system RelE/ParE family toxin [Caldilineaceae bacterium]